MRKKENENLNGHQSWERSIYFLTTSFDSQYIFKLPCYITFKYIAKKIAMTICAAISRTKAPEGNFSFEGALLAGAGYWE